MIDMSLGGQVGIVHSKNGWTPWLVRFVTGSHWSHVIVALDDHLCVSAEPDHAVVKPIRSYDEVVWSQFELTGRQIWAITRWAQQHVGTPYSWIDFYVAGVGALLKRFTPIWLERLAADTDSLICSQLADLALQAGGIDLFRDNRPRGAVTPATFGRYFYEHGWASLP